MNKKIVVLGGGSGLSNLLRGIKKLENVDITAIVTVADSGGSTGILSNQFKIPAVGDLRRVIASLSLDRQHLEESMEYRFNSTNTELDGHTIGNLILTSQILMKKDFAEGIEAASRMLNIKGTVLPVSNQFADLHAELEDGTLVIGEDKIGHSNQRINKVFYKGSKATKSAIDSIKEADYIIFGIGSLYTSLIANLVYPGIKEALKETKGKVIYFSNIWTQPGETEGYSLQDHIDAIESHTHKGVIDLVIFSNTNISDEVVKSYKEDNQYLIQNNNKDAIEKDLVEVYGKDSIKHSEEKILKVMESIIS